MRLPMWTCPCGRRVVKDEWGYIHFDDVPGVSPPPRFKVGDRVHVGNDKTGTHSIRVANATPRYKLTNASGWWEESDLSPVDSPVVCTPSGTRCEEWRRYISTARIFIGETQVNQDAFKGCPYCLGKLREG